MMEGSISSSFRNTWNTRSISRSISTQSIGVASQNRSYIYPTKISRGYFCRNSQITSGGCFRWPKECPMRGWPSIGPSARCWNKSTAISSNQSPSKRSLACSRPKPMASSVHATPTPAWQRRSSRPKTTSPSQTRSWPSATSSTTSATKTQSNFPSSWRMRISTRCSKTPHRPRTARTVIIPSFWRSIIIWRKSMSIRRSSIERRGWYDI
jgi:hypothetical protein